MAGSRSASIDHRRQAAPAGDQQTRQQISSEAADSWGAGRVAPRGRAEYAARSLGERIGAHQNVVVVALANKLARIAWAMLRRGERFATEGMLDGVTFCCFSAACAEKRMIVCERWKARCDPPPRKWSDLRYVFDRCCRKSRRSFGVCPGLHWRGDYEPVLAVVCGLIGIGGHLAAPPLPHHRAYGSVPRRFDRVKRWRGHRVGEGRGRRRSGCAGPVGPPGVRTCARSPSANRPRPPP